MQERIRVLIADDSAVARSIVKAALEDSIYRVDHITDNGADAVTLFKEMSPDVLLIDIEMPLMNGLDAIRQIREFNTEVPVVVISSLQKKGGLNPGYEAMQAGANEFIRKPRVSSRAEAVSSLRAQLLPTLDHLMGRMVQRIKSSRGDPGSILAIGSSTGGPVALSEMLAALPSTFSLPILIVQHMPPKFTKMLSRRLAETTPFTVREAESNARIKPGEIWIAPGGFHLEVYDSEGPRLRLTNAPPENSCRPSVDVLFRSVAALYGRGARAVILTGMGRDGLAGARQIRERGGVLFAQDEATSVVWGMPGAVVREGLAEVVGSPKELAEALQAHALSPRIAV